MLSQDSNLLGIMRLIHNPKILLSIRENVEHENVEAWKCSWKAWKSMKMLSMRKEKKGNEYE